MAAIVADTEALVRLASAFTRPGSGQVPRVIVNPHGFPVRGVVQVSVGFEKHESALADSFRVVDASGIAISCVRLGERMEERVRVRHVSWKRRMVDLLVDVDLPSCGGVAYALEAGVPQAAPRVQAAGGVIENELIRVHLHEDGSLDLLDKNEWTQLHRTPTALRTSPTAVISMTSAR